MYKLYDIIDHQGIISTVLDYTYSLKYSQRKNT